MKKILILKHGSLGDIISSTSVINDIKKHFTRDQVYILTSDKYKDFFYELNFFDNIIIDNREGISKTIDVIKKIISLKIDLIIDLQNSKRTSVYAFILRIFSKTKINGTGGFSTHRYKYDKMNMPSVIDGLSNQIEVLGIATLRKPYLNWLIKKKFDFNKINNQNFFLINPGCSKKNFKKKWPAVNYAKICTYLSSKNILPIIIGAKDDKDEIEEILSLEKNVLNLFNKSPLSIIFQLSQKAIGAISNDTGPAHLIAASGCPIHLILSDFSNTKTVIPQGTNVSFIRKKDIKNILVEEVIEDLNNKFDI